MSLPTPTQRIFFADNGLVLPPTRDSARSLQDFAENGTTPQSKEWSLDERILCIREMQEKWNNQRVVHSMRKDGKAEQGCYLIARTLYEIRQGVPQTGVLVKKGMEALQLSLFKLMINRSGHMVSIGLERLCLESELEERDAAVLYKV
ncbi:MAG: hypothetical protein WAP52_00190 [Candidatus Sungiibacteriota bacterium]